MPYWTPLLRLVSTPLIWRSSPRKSGRWCRPHSRVRLNNVSSLCHPSSPPKQGRKRVADRILPERNYGRRRYYCYPRRRGFRLFKGGTVPAQPYCRTGCGIAACPPVSFWGLQPDLPCADWRLGRGIASPAVGAGAAEGARHGARVRPATEDPSRFSTGPATLSLL